MKHMLAALLALAVLCPFGHAADKETKPKTELDPDVKADRTAVVQGDNQFALDLYAKLHGQEGNLFFSPYSISTALAMTRAGALGDTAAEMDKTLHFSLPQEKLHPALAGLIKEINGDPTDKKRGYQLSTANALWGQKDFGFKADYLKLLNDSYGAGLTELDFTTAAEASRKTINSWVEKETHDKIKELLKQSDVKEDTRLVLTNAIYFKGDWVMRFKKDLTKNAPFYLTADKKVNAPLMREKTELNYFDGGTFQALELPYTGKNLSMVVLLPKKMDGLADLEKDLTADKLAGWIGKLNKQEVNVSLPKFKTTQSMNMRNVLTEMGMSSAFSDKADLSGMAGTPGQLRISDVIHKAYIDVNEEGTEAAAATAVVVFLGGPPSQAPEFRADHPFLFLIRDNRSDSILFLGRVADPTK